MIDKNYRPENFEKFWYQTSEEQGFFSCDPNSKNKPYTIMMPPPNVTGSLHIGHALTFTLQDILIRYNRMNGLDALWQPGMDHAGIATQMVVERQLEENNVKRVDLGRKQFIKKIWEWKNHSGGTIENQLRHLGVSPDWKRSRFTMDEGLSEAVRKVFVSLHKDGLIYRAKRLVNWDPKLLTAISDLEVEQKTETGFMWELIYPIFNSDEKIIVSTTRPETMFGDMAVSVHPDDKRYKKLIGKFVILPITNRKIPIISDEHSDPEKGTGAVKITPAHDFNDFEVGKRHNLQFLNIFDENAFLNENVPKEYQGLDRFDARKKIIKDLEEQGFLGNTNSIEHSVPHGDRSGVPIEPWLIDQWYVDAKKLAEPAIKAVKNKETNFYPQKWEKTFFDWMDNIQPWCVSRQLWWGHQIPAWYGPDGKAFIELNEEIATNKANIYYKKNVELVQDEDVLDTWFSSALWTFSTLGWPNKTPELKRYYPGTVLVTGFDIIFFWVARMMMMGIHFMHGKTPFKDVYIHALVRDEHGQKMSKSKGNVLDPLELTSKYGADALRFTLSALATQGRDIKLSESKIVGYRNFATKIWNASRFLEHNECFKSKTFKEISLPNEVKHPINKWIINELNILILDISKSLENYKFNEASDLIYKFVWDCFCDWYLELIKPFLKKSNETKSVVQYVMFQIIHLLNPFMPFITEEINSKIFKNKNLIISSTWPKISKNKYESSKIDILIKIISEIRTIRNEMKIPLSAKPILQIQDGSSLKKTFNEMNLSILKLARLNEIIFSNKEFPKETAISNVDTYNIGLYLKNIIDFKVEQKRVEKEVKITTQEIEKITKKLNNINFLKNAPIAIIEKNKSRLKAENLKKSKLETALSRLNC